MSEQAEQGSIPPRRIAKKRHGGFTLVEMMVVIVIIGILATIVIVNISGKADVAKVKATEAILKQVAGQVEMFKLAHNEYPRDLMDLVRMPTYVDQKDWPRGGYLTDAPVDGWNRPFMYRVPGSNGMPFDLYSLGEDG